MTVLDFDPPHSPLRLVSTNGSATQRDHRYRDNAALYGDARALYRQVLQASLATHTPVEADGLRVLLASKQATTAVAATTFTSAGIWQLLFVDVVGWCRNRQLDVPTGCARALATTIRHLDATDSLGPGSDTLDQLLEAIDECTGGWADPQTPAPTQSVGSKPASSRTRARGSLRSNRGPKRS